MMPSDDAMNPLVDAGLQGWLCIPNTCGKRAEAILGFDVLRVEPLLDGLNFLSFAWRSMHSQCRQQNRSRAGEGASASELAAARPDGDESVPSQAESPTTLTTSLGQSFGYTEIADARVRSGGQQATSLAEIRRAGERARELVDQILMFGRRGEGGGSAFASRHWSRKRNRYWLHRYLPMSGSR